MEAEDRNGVIIRYAVLIRVGNESSVLYSTEEHLELPYLGFTIQPYTTYTVQVAAETSIGRGPYSEPIRIYTPEDGNTLYK